MYLSIKSKSTCITIYSLNDYFLMINKTFNSNSFNLILL